MIGPNNQGQVTLPRCHRRSVSPQTRASNPRFSSISMIFGSVKYLVKAQVTPSRTIAALAWTPAQ